MIDVNLPLELDDGRPVTFVRMSLMETSCLVTFEGSYRRDIHRTCAQMGENGIFYSIKNGWFNGDVNQTETHHFIRNVDDPFLYRPDLED